MRVTKPLSVRTSDRGECATVLTAEKVGCSPSSPCSRARALCAWLRVAPLLPSPALRAAAWALPCRDGKAGSPIEPESWICDVAAQDDGVSLGIEGHRDEQRSVAGLPAPARVAFASTLIDRMARVAQTAILLGMALHRGAPISTKQEEHIFIRRQTSSRATLPPRVGEGRSVVE